MSDQKIIHLKFKDNDLDGSDSTDSSEYFNMRNGNLINYIINGQDIVFIGDELIIDVTERYRYIPIKVKVLFHESESYGVTTRLPEAFDYFEYDDVTERFQQIRKELSSNLDRDVFNEVYPLFKEYNNKLTNLNIESLGECFYTNQEIIDEYKKNNGVTLEMLLKIMRVLLETIYPEEVMGDIGITTELIIKDGIVSYDMD